MSSPIGSQFRTGYMDDALFNLQGVIEEARAALVNVDFDTLVGTGFSGGVVVPALAMAMGKKFLLVRKDNDDSHHSGRLLGELGSRWIFVDDLISSGRTRERTLEKISDYARDGDLTTECVGTYLYVKRPYMNSGYTPYPY